MGFNLYVVGDEADLERNIRGVCRAVAASQTETGYLLNLVDQASRLIAIPVVTSIQSFGPGGTWNVRSRV